MGRYDNRTISINDDGLYKPVLKRKRLNFIRQYTTPELRFPTPEEIVQLTIIGHIWTTGDALHKLASEHYGDSTMWWVISWFNQKPTDGHFKLGDVVEIPLPLDRILGFIGL